MNARAVLASTPPRALPAKRGLGPDSTPVRRWRHSEPRAPWQSIGGNYARSSGDTYQVQPLKQPAPAPANPMGNSVAGPLRGNNIHVSGWLAAPTPDFGIQNAVCAVSSGLNDLTARHHRSMARGDQIRTKLKEPVRGYPQQSAHVLLHTRGSRLTQPKEDCSD